MAAFFSKNLRRWGYMPPRPQIWVANTGEEEVVQNLSSVVQNYGTIFILKFENGGATCLQTPKFEVWIPGKGRVYKIRAQSYTIVQNMYKIMSSFLFWNLKMVRQGGGGWHGPSAMLTHMNKSYTFILQNMLSSVIPQEAPFKTQFGCFPQNIYNFVVWLPIFLRVCCVAPYVLAPRSQ